MSRHCASNLTSEEATRSQRRVLLFQRLLGHASAQTTLDRYSHLYDDDLEDLADSMDARYSAAQVRPETKSGDLVDLDKKREKVN